MFATNGRSFIAALMLAGLSLAGCAGRPSGNLQALAPTLGDYPGTDKIDMMVATTRSPKGALAGEMFTGERGALAYADIAVSVPPDRNRQVGVVQWPEHFPGDPAKNFVTLRADPVSAIEAQRRFDGYVSRKNGRVLVFVHGFNTRFEEAVYRLAQFSHDSRTPAAPVLFTWPSRGKLLAYAYDRESANYSRDALEEVLHGLVRNPSVKEISILAHSMGNWVAIESLRQMAIRDKRLEPKIASVTLAAPDLDVDVFSEQIRQIGGKRPPFALFTSREDKALGVSSAVWGNVPRLGAIDPEAEPYKAELKRENIHAYDLTNVKSADFLGHGTFAENPEIVRLIGAQLATGQDLNDARQGLGETLGGVVAGAATSVGHAATIAISAPLAVVDPNSRDTIGEHMDALGDSVSHTLPLGGGRGRSAN
jgi:esterase/lipase superfamily enzyme